MSLVQFFRILYARRLILIAAVGSALFAALVTIQLLPPRYTGVARVMLDVIKPDPVTGQVLGTQFLRAYTRTQIELIKDYQIAEQVVDQMGWAQNPEIIARLREKFPEIGEKPDARTVFVKLRELRNRW